MDHDNSETVGEMCLAQSASTKRDLSSPRSLKRNAPVCCPVAFTRCDRFTTIGHTTRHNMVRDEMARVARRYGISVSTEPTFYSYSSGIRQRPDITFHTELPVATDVTVVYPTSTPGEAASKARAAKYKTHDRAVKALNHRFVPAAFEAYGSFDHHVTRLISTIADGLPPTLQYGFKREMQKAIAISLAKGRATAVITAKHRRDGYLEG